MPRRRDNKSDKAPVQCGACGAGITFEPGQLVGDPAAIERVKQLDADLKALAYAIFHSNIDWAEAARSCGDPKCHGDCRHIVDIRRLVRKADGGILPAPGAERDGHA